MPETVRPSDLPAYLPALAESLGRAVADNGGGVLVHVIPQAQGPDVGILPLHGLAPADALLGTVAPEAWSVLGVATGGWARSLDRPSASRVRAEVVVLVPRDGPVVGWVRHGDQVVNEPPASGLTLDGLQRALGLPAAPPEVPVTHLLATSWLTGVLVACRAPRRPPPWSEFADLIPAAVDEGFDWGRLRWLTIEGKWVEPGLTPTEAAWFDDGAFSRWMLSRRPPLPILLAELSGVIGRTEARRYAHKLRRLGIDPTT